MIFYKLICTKDGEKYTFKRAEMNSRNPFLDSQQRKEGVDCEDFCNDQLDKELKLYISQMDENAISIIAVYSGEIDGVDLIDKKVNELLLYLELPFLIASKEEITLKMLMFEIEKASGNNFIKNERELKEKYGLSFNHGWLCERRVPQTNQTKKQLLNECDDIIVDSVLKQEIERIFTPSKSKKFGVPAHYLLNVQDTKDADAVFNILIKSLKNNNRMVRDFYSIIDLSTHGKIDRVMFDDVAKVYNMNKGGVVVIVSRLDVVDDDFYSAERDVINMVAGQIRYHGAEVTTILCCVGKNNGQISAYQSGLTDMLFVEIKDSVLCDDRAKDFLVKHAKSLKIEDIDGLLELVEDGLGYKQQDLINLFLKWHKNYIKTVQFPQYGEFVGKEYKFKEIVQETNALKDLNDLIGLKGVKEVVQNHINYSLLQKVLREDGKKVNNVNRHMCFVGNPGTAKTTVARIIAQIMKEKGLLSQGNLIEVGRADIVSRFVGGTAPLVKDVFERAMGNVLFIDEAYSLCEGKDGMYGDEAINAIVQEMENRRDDVVVIFAGYKNEMQAFLDRNPGLRSRVAYTIDFPDYSEDELMEIAKLHANNMGVDIELCEDKISGILATAKKSKNFGNGRFVRSMLEKARVKQATRLVNEDKLYGENLNILKPEDFEVPTTENKIKMGFC